MSRLAVLMSELCPDGVPYRPLSALAKRNKGTPMTAARMKLIQAKDGPVRVFAAGKTVVDVDEHLIPQEHIVRVPSIIVKSRGHIGFTYYAAPFTHKAELWSYSITHPEVETKFVYYFLLTCVETLQERARATSVKLPQLGVGDTDSLAIPVPPLPVQREIVSILDTMTALADALADELEGRQRQYAEYRESLLTFGDEVPRSTLGGVCTKAFSGGTPLTSKPEYYGGEIPWLRTQEVSYSDITSTAMTITDEGLRNSSARWVKADSVIVAISGAGVTRGRVAVNKIPLATNQHCCNLEIDPSIAHYRFVFHWVSFRYHDLRSLGQGNRSDLNVGIIKGYPLPLPPLAEQMRIAELLDCFDALINDTTSGLPAEMAARSDQFGHYLRELLAFPEASAA